MPVKLKCWLGGSVNRAGPLLRHAVSSRAVGQMKGQGLLKIIRNFMVVFYILLWGTQKKSNFQSKKKVT